MISKANSELRVILTKVISMPENDYIDSNAGGTLNNVRASIQKQFLSFNNIRYKHTAYNRKYSLASKIRPEYPYIYRVYS